jgi:predicted TIM-barrel fold metal-dependent hydrolase
VSQPARPSRSAQIRARLDHPIIDADAHLLEFFPAYMDAIAQVGGPRFRERYQRRLAQGHATGDWSQWNALDWEQRRDGRVPRGAWWGLPTRNTYDAATAMLPRLLRERLDDLGIDLLISYGGLTLYLPLELDEETRRTTVRALNTAQADIYREHADRILPAAAIPMFTPQEALEELEHAVRDLGFRVIMVPAGVPRPIPALARRLPDAFPRDACWIDGYGLDSEHDYDLFWARCVELGVAVTAHSGILPNLPWYGRSISSFVYNHLGNHAYHLGLMCKSIFLGGVTRRFPRLHFAFLEGGVAWAVQMFAEIVSTWDKRNLAALDNVRPSLLDRQLYLELVARYGGKWVEGKLDLVAHGLPVDDSNVPAELRDEWAALAIARREELGELFAERFFFGCEADDPCTSWAFARRTNPFGAALRATLGSDIGHYDVPDMTRVIEEAYESVERGWIEPDDFRDLVFGNAVRLHGGMNPVFFKGTCVEDAAARVLTTA